MNDTRNELKRAKAELERLLQYFDDDTLPDEYEDYESFEDDISHLQSKIKHLEKKLEKDA